MKSCKILWSTQSGRAKACARRTRRILMEEKNLEIEGVGSAFDETELPFIQWINQNITEDTLLLLFVSTTGDGQHCDSIRNSWNTLLQKSLPRTLFEKKQFALFCLGDRAYGPQFCAAGRKLAVRLLQLGMENFGSVGYGDDNTPNGGVFRDLDNWLEQDLLPLLEARSEPLPTHATVPKVYQVTYDDDDDDDNGDSSRVSGNECEHPRFESAYSAYFRTFRPVSAYTYNSRTQQIDSSDDSNCFPLDGTITENIRITATEWEQDTRHITIDMKSASKSSAPSNTPPYCAGDIATVLPFNSDEAVTKFLKVLPKDIQKHIDRTISINVVDGTAKGSFTPWPRKCTLRGLLKYCADIQSLPEREDLRALSFFCSQEDDAGKAQRDKLRSLSETAEAALYADYILREKRSWADVLYDFESLFVDGSTLTLEDLLAILPPMRPRDFSIASAPAEGTKSVEPGSTFPIELCVAVVKGTTKRGRPYHGLCSEYLSRQVVELARESESPRLKIWIRPGSFGKLPLELSGDGLFTTPVLCVGAGTGVAPMRSLLRERVASKESSAVSHRNSRQQDQNILIFGCRKQESDYYYRREWESIEADGDLQVLTAFSRDQYRKIYVQQVLRTAESGELITNHLLKRGGAVYVAGGPRMARAVKDEILEVLEEALGSSKNATVFLNKLQRKGLFSVEAWG